MDCPLCNCQKHILFHSDQSRIYRQCQECHFVFVPAKYYLSSAAEKTIYDKHQNDPTDAGYRNFLSRLATPLLTKLTSASQGLDFGCGPGPTLSLMMEEAGHQVELYDKFYAPHEAIWNHHFDFITATEVVEHLHNPGLVLSRLWACLRPGGYLGIMTKLVTSPEAFSQWHYKNDLTHVGFFSRETWRFWALARGAELEFFQNDVILLRQTKCMVL